MTGDFSMTGGLRRMSFSEEETMYERVSTEMEMRGKSEQRILHKG